MNRLLIDAEYVLEQYELLRRKAIQVYGLHLFSAKGMVVWIEAVSCLSGRQAMSNEFGSSPPPICSQPEVTTVLANMVLGCMEEAHA